MCYRRVLNPCVERENDGKDANKKILQESLDGVIVRQDGLVCNRKKVYNGAVAKVGEKAAEKAARAARTVANGCLSVPNGTRVLLHRHNDENLRKDGRSSVRISCGDGRIAERAGYQDRFVGEESERREFDR